MITGTRGNIEDLPAMVADMKIRLEDTFTLTTEQTVRFLSEPEILIAQAHFQVQENVRAIIQDLIYQAHRLKYKPAAFPTEVEVRCCAHNPRYLHNLLIDVI